MCIGRPKSFELFLLNPAIEFNRKIIKSDAFRLKCTQQRHEFKNFNRVAGRQCRQDPLIFGGDFGACGQQTRLFRLAVIFRQIDVQSICYILFNVIISCLNLSNHSLCRIIDQRCGSIQSHPDRKPASKDA